MDTRREFIRKALLLSGAAGMTTLPPSIVRALSIDPRAGSTFLDAEHIVVLMQENRSFDHTFGTLRGVRGFNDPRAITMPDRNKVWLQKNAAGETYSPFRLDIKDTRISWMGSLPHGRESQIGARNNGRCDNWIEAKKSSEEHYEDIPLTMGYYTREDIPFYYALADAFTICDQNFCSSLTPTDPNRVYFWSGTVRAAASEDSRAYMDNGSIEEGLSWRTFPELLESNGISWKIYQNEMSIDVGLSDEEDAWLGNFGDNALQYFDQYQVKFLKEYVEYLPKKISLLEQDIKVLESKMSTRVPGSKEDKKAQKVLKAKRQLRAEAGADLEKYSPENYQQLSAQQKAIHEKAFTTNRGDAHRHDLTPLNYMDETINREINIPKGDVLFQFREDVGKDKLPTVSWIVPPQNFSDHPSAPWFGSWYLSEVMDILTRDPEVWRKTIFILAYDENDGYFDHVPPFTAPDPREPDSGKVSEGIDAGLEQVRLEKDVPGPIGLGFRVPLVIASPWSRGGFVNSQVFDHTSTLQFLEVFLSNKFSKSIRETNISQWRRTVCGDLTSTFQKYDGKKISGLPFIERAPFIEGIHKAKFKHIPSNFKKLSTQEIEQINHNQAGSRYMPQQEKGGRPSCPLPYHLDATGELSADKGFVSIGLSASSRYFGKVAAGAPFIVYCYGRDFKIRNYAVSAGDQLVDQIPISEFENGHYEIRVDGPNGFFRSFRGSQSDPPLLVTLQYEDTGGTGAVSNPELTGRLLIKVLNPEPKSRYKMKVIDHLYHSHDSIIKEISHENGQAVTLAIMDTRSSFCWYDFSVFLEGVGSYEKRFAGHLETGKESRSDPAIG